MMKNKNDLDLKEIDKLFLRFVDHVPQATLGYSKTDYLFSVIGTTVMAMKKAEESLAFYFFALLHGRQLHSCVKPIFLLN
jgi:hypothetical protein